MAGFRIRRRWPRFCTSQKRVGLQVHEAVRCRRGVEPIHYSRHTKPCVVLQERRHEGDTKLMLDKAPALSTATFKQRLSTIFYLTAITVSMIGWLSAFGWVTLAVARWLMA